MNTQTYPFQRPRKLTRLAEALAEKLFENGLPLISDYDLFLQLYAVYFEGKVKYLRGYYPTRELFLRTKVLLISHQIISKDQDYHVMWRIGLVSDAPADEIVCISDQFCYISHLSAMQRYGITDRRPEALSITQMNRKLAKDLLAEKKKGDFQKLKETEVENVYVPNAYVTHHPTRVRRRPIHISTKSNYGEWRAIKGTYVRVSAIGQTFADMLSEPDLCGGMFHVLGCWDRHAKVYFEEIVSNLDVNAHDIQKVRAGYILEERLGIADRRVLAWKAFAQRGGSRVLDPGAPFESKYSKDWMISLNVG